MCTLATFSRLHLYDQLQAVEGARQSYAMGAAELHFSGRTE